MKIAGIKNFEKQMPESRTSYNNKIITAHCCQLREELPFARPFELINNLGIVQDRTIKRSRQQSAKRYNSLL